MELRQLKYFKAVADARSFAHGARYLRVAQPALSRSIAKLEDELGHSLFVRHSSGVTLTDIGGIFYEQTLTVLAEAEKLYERLAAEQEDTLRGHVTLGAPQSVQSKVVAPVVADFLKLFPECTLDLVQDSSSRLSDRVLEGTIDLAILSQRSVDAGMHRTSLMTESICLFAKEEDISFLGNVAHITDLAKLPLLSCGYPTGLRNRLDRELKRQTESPSIRAEVNSSTIMLDLVVGGAGVGIAPSCVAAQPRAGGLSILPVEGLEISWSLVTNWSKRGSRIVQKISSMLADHVDCSITSGDWPTARII